MTTQVLEKNCKKTFSVKPNISKRLDKYKNKSKIVNQALFLYFQKEDYMLNAEKEFFDSIQIEDFSDEQISSLAESKENKNLDNTILNLKL